MPMDTGFYGAYGDEETGSEFKPAGEPEKLYAEGGASVPTPAAGLPVEPARAAGDNPFVPGEKRSIRYTSKEQKQPIEKTAAHAGIPTEPGV